MSKNHSDFALKFLKIEQTIHLITNITATQDISSYLLIIEEVCQDDRISEVIMLLQRKQSDWHTGYSESYRHVVQFLLPCLKFVTKMKLNFKDILSMTKKDIEEVCIEHLKQLTDILPQKEIGVDFGVGSHAKDFSLTLKELKKVKAALVQSAGTKDDEFYYTLGLLSFSFHLLNHLAIQDYTFFKICSLSLSYQGNNI